MPNLGTGSVQEVRDSHHAKTRDPLTFLDHSLVQFWLILATPEVKLKTKILQDHLLDEVLVAHAAECHSAICYRHRNLRVRNGRFSNSTAEVRPVAPDR